MWKNRGAEARHHPPERQAWRPGADGWRAYRRTPLWRRLPSLLYRGFPNPRTVRPPATPHLAPRAPNSAAPADLEIGDTAGLETCATAGQCADAPVPGRSRVERSGTLAVFALPVRADAAATGDDRTPRQRRAPQTALNSPQMWTVMPSSAKAAALMRQARWAAFTLGA